MSRQPQTSTVVGMTTLIGDSRVADIPVFDNHEPLVDLAAQGILCDVRPRHFVTGRMVRAGLADRLIAADASLPPGVRLLVMEGFRTARSQQRILNRYSGQLRTYHPEIGDVELRRLTSRFVAPLDVAPHVAGAAVDVTLVDGSGLRLDMGTSVDATPEDSRNACAFDAETISIEARTNRGLLATALTATGLVNYPTEWWHWSYGDRYWAYMTSAAQACYGSLKPGRAALTVAAADRP
jgi:zinc D-Ala-D-Ala dipeptidase